MESTEHPLGEEHLSGCLRLSGAAHWNQNAADWRLMLAIGSGWGITLADGSLAASTVVLPYGGKFAWVSMVLVLPEHRRKGYATQLLRVALAELGKRGQIPILDATPAGHEVYAQEGFRDTWGFRRFALKEIGGLNGKKIQARPITAPDWPQILQLDAIAFGASREGLLRNLAARLPGTALVAEQGGELAGFVLGREGREANQVGPLVARDGKTAAALLEAAVRWTRSPVYVDIADRASGLQSWVQARGFEFQRPFVRMVHGMTGTARAPGDESLVYCPAGPELG